MQSNMSQKRFTFILQLVKAPAVSYKVIRYDFEEPIAIKKDYHLKVVTTSTHLHPNPIVVLYFSR